MYLTSIIFLHKHFLNLFGSRSRPEHAFLLFGAKKLLEDWTVAFGLSSLKDPEIGNNSWVLYLVQNVISVKQ